MTIFTKLLRILTTGFRVENLQSSGGVISHALWQPCFLKDQISFSYFCRGHLVSISAKLFSIRQLVS